MSESGNLRHIVMFQFMEGTDQLKIDEVVHRFTELQSLVPGINEFEWGLNNSSEGLSAELTHCFILTFASVAERDAYLPHPDHTAFSKWVRPWLAKVVVFDFSL